MTHALKSIVLGLILSVCAVLPIDAQVAYFIYQGEQFANYKANNRDGYNPTGDLILVSRKGVGRFLINFKSIGKLKPNNGPPYVQLTTVGSGSSICKPGGWVTKGIDLLVGIDCSSMQGQAVDAHFNLLAGWPQNVAQVPRIHRIPSHPRPTSRRNNCVGNTCDKSLGDTRDLAGEIDDLYEQVDEIRTELNASAQ
jgi:hypothetical protein